MPPSSQSPNHERKVSEHATESRDFSTSSKRKSSASTHSQNGKDEAENGNGKKKRRKVNHACVYCRRSHMTCDLERPCTRCVKRDIGHLCHDEPREGQRRSGSEVGAADLASAMEAAETTGKQDMVVAGAAGLNGGMGGYATTQRGDSIGDGSSIVDGGGQPQIAQPTPVSPVQLQRPSTAGTNMIGLMSTNFDWNNSSVQNQFQDMHHLYPNNMFNTSEVTNEYNLLNDFLSSSLIDDGALYSNDDTNALFNDPLLNNNSVNAALNPAFNPQQLQQQQQFQLPPQPALQPRPTNTASAEEISRPPSTHPSTEATRTKFYLTAADPAGTASAEDRLHKLLKAKYDAGMLKPFNYVKGYARLNAYMSRHLKRDSQVRILKQLDRFRPKFRSAAEKLTDMQLVLVEMWFERSLMEYDRVFASMAIPACCWRRTGEIFRGNREMAELVGVGWEELRDGRLALHEILAEEGLVSYWEKFGAIAFDASQKAILTSCALKCPARRDGGNSGSVGGETGQVTGQVTVKCCFSFTIKRDTHNIPSLIVGNFIPITPRRPRVRDK